MTEQEEDVLWASYLGLRVLRTMCRAAGLIQGAGTAQAIVNEIDEIRPDFAARARQSPYSGEGSVQ